MLNKIVLFTIPPSPPPPLPQRISQRVHTIANDWSILFTVQLTAMPTFTGQNM